MARWRHTPKQIIAKLREAEVALAKRLRGLEKENAQLKKLVGEQALDLTILMEVAKGNF